MHHEVEQLDRAQQGSEPLDMPQVVSGHSPSST
jgi:hypothetical protein